MQFRDRFLDHGAAPVQELLFHVLHDHIESTLRGDLRDSDDLVGFDAETISVKVTKGSKTIKSATAGDFAARAGRDLVAGGPLSKDAIVARRTSADEIVLSEAWTGATGTVKLTFHHDMRNYAVHFELPVAL